MRMMMSFVVIIAIVVTNAIVVANAIVVVIVIVYAIIVVIAIVIVVCNGGFSLTPVPVYCSFVCRGPSRHAAIPFQATAHCQTSSH